MLPDATLVPEVRESVRQSQKTITDFIRGSITAWLTFF